MRQATSKQRLGFIVGRIVPIVQRRDADSSRRNSVADKRERCIFCDNLVRVIYAGHGHRHPGAVVLGDG